MKLNQIVITSAKLYRQNFNFGEVYGIMQRDIRTFQEFQQENLPAGTRMLLFGLKNTDGTSGVAIPLALMETPEKCADLFPQFFARKASGLYTISLPALCRHCSEAYAKLIDRSPSINWLPDGRMADDVEAFLLEMTHQGTKAFSPENAVMLFLYLLLHLQIGLSPMHADSLQQLHAMFGDDLCTDNAIKLDDKEQFIDLGDAYNGAGGSAGRMEIVEFIGAPTAAVELSIRNTPLRRRVNPGERLYAIRKEGKFVSFLPRFVPAGEAVLLMDNAQLCIRYQNQTHHLQTEFESPANWAYAMEYGTFILSKDGRLDPDNVCLETEQDQPCVAVSAMGLDYCLLRADGEVDTAIEKTGWHDLIHISLGLNAAIAIRADRRAILSDGTVLRFADVVDAQAYNEHYICLNAQGQVYADGGLRCSGAQAIAISEAGYAVALEDKVCIYGFDGSVRGSLPERVTELAASDRALIYRDDPSGVIQVCPFEEIFGR